MTCTTRGKYNRTVNQLYGLANQFPIYFNHAYLKALNNAQANDDSGITAEQEEVLNELEWVKARDQEITYPIGINPSTIKSASQEQYKFNREEVKATKAPKRTKKDSVRKG